jgi:hypothetical protein
VWVISILSIGELYDTVCVPGAGSIRSEVITKSAGFNDGELVHWFLRLMSASICYANVIAVPLGASFFSV